MATLPDADLVPQIGLPPLARRDARVLILGSFPGQLSLSQQEYYAHPRNVFWSIMHAITGVPADRVYVERVRALSSAGFALWDVCASAIRPGSADSAIRGASVIPNDLVTFLRAHRQITAICFNGQTAAVLFQRHVHPLLSLSSQTIPITILPSSSPAHAGMPLVDKAKRWHDALRAL